MKKESNKSPRQSIGDLHRAGTGMRSLEPRFMFDAAGFATGAEVAADTVAESQAEAAFENGQTNDNARWGFDSERLMEALQTVPPSGTSSEIVFIDTSVQGYETLLEGIDPSAEVVFLDVEQDGLTQILEALQNRSDVSAIHIISHGDMGEVTLGNTVLNSDSMSSEHAETLALIGEALSDEADILIYGCNFAEGEVGNAAANLLADLTGADVAASTDLTGHSDVGADWELEYASGSIETAGVVSEIAQQNFRGLLMDTDGDGVDDSVDVDDDNDGILDVDESQVLTISSGNIDVPPNVDTNAPSNLMTTVDLTSTGLQVGDQVTVSNFQADGDLNGGTETFFFIINDGFADEVTETGLRTGFQFSGLSSLVSDPGPFVFTVQDIGSGNVGLFIELEANAAVDALGNPYVVRLTFDITYIDPAGIDTDLDGILDQQDIDSDNDGITDTVEAQTTEDYIIPSGSGAGITDVNGDGLDDNFDAGVIGGGAPTGVGLTPVDSDSDTTPDFRDADSDNDGTDDIAERDDEQPTSLTSTTDTDGDGLVDIFESSVIVDADVNDENLTGLVFNLGDEDDDVLPDGSNASGLSQNLDYRENVSDDTDEDGIENNLDLDADNDGIINTNEGWTSTFNDDNSSLYVPGNVEVVPIGGGTGTTNIDIDLSSTGLQVGDKIIVTDFLADGDLNSPGFGETFSLNFNNGEMQANGLSTGGQFSGFIPLTTPITWEITVIDIDPGAGVTPGITLESVIEAGVDDFAGTGYGVAFNFQIEYTIYTETDTDLDGVPDHLDIDSDNDGITDTVEAQATDLYILPSGVGAGITDTNMDGLDDVFDDPGLNGVGLTPVNTDGDGLADVLDPDSDGDGINDIVERGDGGPTSITSTADVDFDGLLDIFEGSNNVDQDVNDENVSGTSTATLVFNLADSDGDTDDDGQNAVQPSIDLDYRENQFADIDNDGLTNDVDDDADNDGILNVDEGFGPTTISTGNIDSITGADGESDPETLTIDLSQYDLAIGSTVNISNLQADGDIGDGGETFSLTFNPGDASEVSETGLAPGGGYNDYDGLTGVTTVISTVTVIDIGGGTPGIVVTLDSTDDVDQANDADPNNNYAVRVVFDVDFTSQRDTDDDGLPDYLDIDSDNDGITDNIEAQPTSENLLLPSGTVDGNGVDLNFAGGITPVDTDGDTIPDFIDEDSDDDVRQDVAERGDGQPVVVTSTADSDNDGLLDIFEGSSINDGDVNDENVSGTTTMTLVYNLADTDGDTPANGAGADPVMGIDFDYRDGLIDFDGDGIIDTADVDADGDGILNVDEGSLLAGMVSSGNIDLGDGPQDSGILTIDLSGNNLEIGDTVYVTDFFADGDLDSDASIEFFRIDINQGEYVSPNLATGAEQTGLVAVSPILNVPVTVIDIGGGTPGIEFRITTPEGVNEFGGYGFGVRVNFNVTWEARDTDGDGRPDWLDIDSDNDGITDNVEAQTTAGYVEPDGVDTQDTSGSPGADGLDDVYGQGLNRVGVNLIDTDGDGIADVYDDDSDADGIGDIAERDDGQPRTVFSMADADADGLLDIFEGSNLFDTDANDENLDPTNTNFNLGDVDNDTDDDGANANPALNIDFDYRDQTDTDGDGVANLNDDDTDNDGILNVDEGLTSIPGSITSQNIDIDETATSTMTATSTTIDLSGTGLVVGDTVTVSNLLADGDLDTSSETFTVTFNGSDTFAGLQTGEGFLGPTDLTAPISVELTVIDIGSGTPGISVEAFVDPSSDDEIALGYAVRFTVEVSWTAPDTDGDGIFDYLDLDSDNDGLSDLFESGSAAAIAADANQDGTLSLGESAVSGTGVPMVVGGGTTPQDSETVPDGIPDFLDLDSDDDGIADTIEFRATTGYVANDGDVRDNDLDGDGIIDLFDPNDSTTGDFGGSFAVIGNDADGDGTPDYLDDDSDSDTLNDSAESGFTFSGTDSNQDGIDDNATIGVSYSDPDGVVTTPSADLPNQAGDTSEIAFRESDLMASDDTVQIGEVNESTGATLSANPVTNDTYVTNPAETITVVSVSSASTGGVPTPVPGGGSAMILTDLGAQVTVSSAGVIDYNPNGVTQLTDLNFGDAPVVDSFTYTIEVLGTITASATVDITVQPNNEYELASLTGGDGSDGTAFNGAVAGDQAGFSVANLGDVNGDGYDDIAIGAVTESTNGTYAGATYVLFGNPSGFSANFELSTLHDGNGADGFVIRGIDAQDFSGRSIAGGDVNGDGYADIIIGAPRADPNGNASGETYVIFGRADFSTVLSTAPGNSGVIELSDIPGGDATTGIVLNGAAADDNSGRWVAFAGDVNGDGIGDFLIGAPFADPNGASSGETYLVYGKTDFSPLLGSTTGVDTGTIQLSDLSLAGGGDGTHGTIFKGEAANDYSGNFVVGDGDFNGDGLQDIVIGAYYAGYVYGVSGASGSSYLIYGSAAGFGAEFELSSVNGSNGFEVTGSEGDYAGKSLALIDFNGDGFDDLVVTAPYATVSYGGTDYDDAGVTYVIYGETGTPFAATQTLDSVDDVTINGARADNAGAGFKVTSAGDVNSDGFEDLLVGRVPVAGVDQGAAYVIFGGDSLPATIEVSEIVPDAASTVGGGAGLTVATGFVLSGIDADDYAGQAVATAGDFNGDGFDDLLIGAYTAEPNGTYSGEAYLIYGKDYLYSQPINGTSGADSLSGSLAEEVLIGGVGADLVNGGLGDDVLIGGAGDDIVVYEENDTRRVDGGGGNDTLSFVGRSGLTLDLTAENNGLFTSFENIDLTGLGDNTVILSTEDVLALSESTNLLVIEGNTGDSVVISDLGSWTYQGTQGSYEVYTNGEAELRIDSDITISQLSDEHQSLEPVEDVLLLAESGEVTGDVMQTFSEQVNTAQGQFAERANKLLQALITS